MNPNDPLIPKHGGYRNLLSFQIAQLVYDVTLRFCNKYISKYSRTHDQMVQAARSGVQNIAEGSQASGTSKKTEIKLTSVARASLEELYLDYEDYLRQHNLPTWEKTDPRRQELIDNRFKTADEVIRWVKDVFNRENGGPSGPSRQMSGQNPNNQHPQQPPTQISHDQNQPHPPDQQTTHNHPSTHLSTSSTQSTIPGIAANATLVLITVACSLLDRQLSTLSKKFLHEGGFTERLYHKRKQHRRWNE